MGVGRGHSLLSGNQAMDGRDGLRCPECRAIDWQRDGYAIVEDDGLVFPGRVAPSTSVDVVWTCSGCGRDLEMDSPASYALTELELTHLG
jgi:DNA-directed RNA polymerase subunit RPC12/RpoP